MRRLHNKKEHKTTFLKRYNL